MNEWIPIDKKLPRHATHVLVVTNRGAQAVVIFIDNKTAMNELRMKGVDVPKSEDVGFSFCSQEKNGETLNGVTHWMYLPRAP